LFSGVWQGCCIQWMGQLKITMESRGGGETNAQTKAPMMNLDLVFITNTQAKLKMSLWAGEVGVKMRTSWWGQGSKRTFCDITHLLCVVLLSMALPTIFFSFLESFASNHHPIRLFLLYDRQASQPAAWVGPRPTSVDGQARTSWPHLQTLDEHVYHHPPAPKPHPQTPKLKKKN
jgi:hypothetical protein